MMSTLTSITEAIIPTMQEIRKLNEEIKNLENYRRRKDQLKKVVDPLRILVKQAQLLNKYYKIEFDFLKSIHKAKSSTETLYSNFRENSSVIIEIDDEYFNNWQAIIKNLTEALRNSWKEYIKVHIFQIDESEFELMESFRVFQSELDKVKLARKHLTDLLVDLPPTIEFKWLEINEANKQLRCAWEEISFEHLPPIIKSFIRVAKLDGVALDDYTEEVQSWLEENNLKTNFKIKLAPKHQQ